MTFLIMQPSAASRKFPPFRSKHSPQCRWQK